VTRMGEGRGVYAVLVGRPEGKRPLGRPRHRCKDNIKMDLRETISLSRRTHSVRTTFTLVNTQLYTGDKTTSVILRNCITYRNYVTSNGKS
jgi:hypothetical protein